MSYMVRPVTKPYVRPNYISSRWTVDLKLEIPYLRSDIHQTVTPVKLFRHFHQAAPGTRQPISPMVYRGQPSTACFNCRQVKKGCDQKLPACSRCVRLGKTCGGYRELSIFRDQSDMVTRRLGGTPDYGSGPSTRQLIPDKATVIRNFFYEHFVGPSYLSFLENVTPDDLLLQSILACGAAALANRNGGNRQGRELARQYYVEAITTTNEALRHQRRVKEDNTLIAVFLLGIFEEINWEGSQSRTSLLSHVSGVEMLLQLRGRSQIRTKTGASLFRDLRVKLIINALANEVSVPRYIVQWTQALDYDQARSCGDKLVILASRCASLRQSFRLSDVSDAELLETCNALEVDLRTWCEITLAEGLVCSFYDVNDPDTAHSWSGVRHENGIPQEYRYWNLWRTLRISLSRMQEELWRRSWPNLVHPEQGIPNPERYRSVRARMAADICIDAGYTFGNDMTVEPTKGSISSGLLLINACATAGTCLLEELVEPTTTPGGTRMILVDRAFHHNPLKATSGKLAWLIDLVDYLVNKVGIGHASGVGEFLRGNRKLFFDVSRSRLVRNIQDEMQQPPCVAETLDLSHIDTSEGQP